MANTEFNWGFQVAHEPAHRGALRYHPAGARVAVRGMDEYMYGHQRFVSGPNGMRNFHLCARGLDFPLARCARREWVWTEIAKRLGNEVVQGYQPPPGRRGR